MTNDYDTLNQEKAPRFRGVKSFAMGMAAALVTATGIGTGAAKAGPLMDRIEAGEPIRLGYISAPPWCGQGPDGTPNGFANEIVVGSLKAAGFDNIESIILTDWAGVIPALNAGQYDIASCGLYILGERFQNMAFANPLGVMGMAFVVPAGNPQGINTVEDVIEKGIKLSTTAGSAGQKYAKEGNVPEGQMTILTSDAEVFAAMNSGRVDAALYNYFTSKELVDRSNGKFELSDMSKMPIDTKNWPAAGFRPDDADFVELYNEGQKKYLGSEEMLAVVEDDGFTEMNIPDPSVTADWVCENR